MHYQRVEAVLRIMHAEIKRGMTLMGCRSVKEITRDKVIFRKK
jgi:L-lactate dehydrogenase (cytochrome)